MYVLSQQVVMRGEGHSSWIQSVTFDPWAVQSPLYRFISVADDAKLCLWEYDARILTLQRQRQHTSSQHIALQLSPVVSPAVNRSSSNSSSNVNTGNSTATNTQQQQQQQQQHVNSNAANSSSSSSGTSSVQQHQANSNSSSNSSNTSQPLNPLKRFSARYRSSDKLSSFDKTAAAAAGAETTANTATAATTSSSSSSTTDSNTQHKHQHQQQQHVSRGTSASSITLDTKQTYAVRV
jgi:hypothetical protein